MIDFVRQVHDGTETTLDVDPADDAVPATAVPLYGRQYVRATVKITEDSAGDYAEVIFWTSDDSGVWAKDKRINGTGLFRAVYDTDNSAVCETLHVVGAKYVYLQFVGRTDSDVRLKSWLTLCDDPA